MRMSTCGNGRVRWWCLRSKESTGVPARKRRQVCEPVREQLSTHRASLQLRCSKVAAEHPRTPVSQTLISISTHTHGKSHSLPGVRSVSEQGFAVISWVRLSAQIPAGFFQIRNSLGIEMRVHREREVALLASKTRESWGIKTSSQSERALAADAAPREPSFWPNRVKWQVTLVFVGH